MLDSNVLAKLVLNEPGSNEARANITRNLKKGYSIHTVDLALAESLNVVWKHVNLLKDLKVEDAGSIAEDIAKVYDGLNIVKAREIAQEALQIALTQNITIYDALYIAAAQKLKGTLYTADQKLCAIATRIANTQVLKPKK